MGGRIQGGNGRGGEGGGRGSVTSVALAGFLWGGQDDSPGVAFLLFCFELSLGFRRRRALKSSRTERATIVR